VTRKNTEGVDNEEQVKSKALCGTVTIRIAAVNNEKRTYRFSRRSPPHAADTPATCHKRLVRNTVDWLVSKELLHAAVQEHRLVVDVSRPNIGAQPRNSATRPKKRPPTVSSEPPPRLTRALTWSSKLKQDRIGK
jgi:hypothetical protein